MDWNPFHLGGPAFLVYYAGLMVLTLLALRAWIRAGEAAAAPPPPKFDDPYLIACLRGGADEALRVASVSLVDRGLLRLDGERLVLRDAAAVELARRDIERAVLRACRGGARADAVLRDAAARSAAEACRRRLEDHGLLAGAALRRQRLPKVAIAAALLLGTALMRIVQALSHGRHNIGFLSALALLAAVLLLLQWRRARSGAGDAALADLRLLFKRLKDRAKTLAAGGAGSDAALLAAVFGLAALPAAAFPQVERLYPRQSSDSSAGGGSSDSSSGCGSSCGGGCGGGGCGGV